MKVSAKDLREALAFVGAAVERTHTLPILSHVLIESREGGARLVTSDLEMELTADIEATGEVPALCVSHEKLKSCAIDDGEMEISKAGAKVAISVGRSKHTFGFLRADDFPRATIAGDAIELPAELVVPGLKRVSHAMAVQDIRYYLNGVGIERRNNLLSLFSSDGHRGALVRHESKGADFAAIIPRAAVLAIVAMTAETLTLHLVDGIGSVTASKGRLSLQAKLIDGKHPDWRRVFVDCPLAFSADRDELLSALKSINPGLGKFMFGKIVVNGSGVVSGAADGNESTCEFDVTGDGYDAGFNVDHVSEAIAECSTDRVTLRHKGDAISTLRIDDGKWSAVIMPARV